MSKNAFQVRHGLRAGSTLVIDSNGNWVGNVITPTYGGVGITSYAVGDILYASGSGTLSKLVVGSNTDVLTLAGGIPTWAAPTGGSGGAAGSPLLDIRGGDGIDVTFGSPKVTVAVDSTVVRDGDNISTLINDANYLKTIGSPFLDIRGGTGITVAFGSPRVTITNSDPNVDQNLFLNVLSDSGTAVADTTTDTLSILGGTGISTAVSADAVTITNDDPNVDQNLWLNIASDVGGPVAANTTTDTLTIAGGKNVRTNIAGDTVTINMTGSPFAASGSPDSYLENIVEDLSPQLGANLDLNAFDITGSGEISITSAGSDHASIKAYHTTQGGFNWETENVAGITRLYQTSSAGTQEDIILEHNRNTTVALFWNGDQKFFTDQFGFGTNDSIFFVGQSSVSYTPGAGSGAIWLDSDTDILYFRDDGATNYNLITPNIVGGTGITVATGSPQFTITNSDPNVDQNLFLNVASDAGTAVADTTTDTLTLTGGTQISTSVSADTVTFDWAAALNDLSDVTAVGSPTGQLLYSDGTNWVTLPKGTNSQVLTMGSPLLPSWKTGAALADGTADGQMLIWDETTDNAWEAAVNLNFNDTTPALEFYTSAGATKGGEISVGTGPTRLIFRDSADAVSLEIYSTLIQTNQSFRVQNGFLEVANAAGSIRASFNMDTTANVLTLAATASTVNSLTLNGLDLGIVGNIVTSEPTPVASTALLWACSDANSVALYNRGENVNAPLDNLGAATWRFNTPTTPADPATTLFRLNSATPASVTEIYIDDEDAFGDDASWFLDGIEAGDVITLRSTAGREKFFIATVDVVTDNTGWYTLEVTLLDQGTTNFTNVDHVHFELQKISAATGTLPNIVGGTGITVATGSPQFTITNSDPNVDQNLWLNIAGDVGGPVAANTTTDTLTIAGGTNVRTNIAGDTITINMTGSPFTSGGGGGSPNTNKFLVKAGSPITIINYDSLALKQTLRIYAGSPDTAYADFDHNSGRLNIVTNDTDAVKITMDSATETADLILHNPSGAATIYSQTDANDAVAVLGVYRNDTFAWADFGVAGTTYSKTKRRNRTFLSFDDNLTNLQIVGFGTGSPEHIYAEYRTGSPISTSVYELKEGTRFRIFDQTDTDFADFYHDGDSFVTAFTTTNDWDISGLTGQFDLRDATAVQLHDDMDLVIYSTGDANGTTLSQNGVDFEITGVVATDINITGYTSIQAGTVDADFDAITGTTFNGVALTTAGAATNFLDETGSYTALTSNATHTGQVTGATALVLDVTAVTAQPASGAIIAADTIIINDGGVLSEATFTQMDTYFNSSLSFGSGTVTSVSAGNGLDFTTITATGPVTLGTPGSTTSSSTNAVTATSHTHAVDSTIATSGGAFHDGFSDFVANEHIDWTADQNPTIINIDNLAADVNSVSPVHPFVSYDRTSSGANYNDFLDSGIFGMGSSETNDPNNGSFNTMSVFRNSSDVRVQVVYPRLAGNSIAHRGYAPAGSPQFFEWHYPVTSTTQVASYAIGDVLYASTATDLTRLAVGSNTNVLTLAGGVPTWAAPATAGTVTSVTGGVGVASTGGTTPSISLTVDELAEKSGAVVGTDRLVGTTATTNWAETISGIPLSIFNDDLGHVENVSTTLSVGTVNTTTVAITSDGGADDVILPAATVSAAGMLTTAKWGEIVANTAKVTNVSTTLSVGTVGANTVAITSDGGADDVTLPAATVSAAGMLTTAKWGEIVANTAKVTNATHTGQVTGATALALDVTAVTAQPASGAIIAADTIIINDGGVLSEATFTQMDTYFNSSLSFGGVTASTGADNRLAVFTTGTNIEGDANLSWNSEILLIGGVLQLTERADHTVSPSGGRGEIWVKSGSLGGELMYTEGDQDQDFTAYNVIETVYHHSQTITDADPGAGNMRWDSLTPASVTELYIDDIDETGRDASFMLANLADGDVITMRSMWSAADYLVCSVNGSTTDNTGYWTIPVTIIHSDSVPTTGDPMHITIEWQSQAPGGGVPTTITVADESADTTCFPLFVTAATGDLGPKTGTNITFNSATGAFTATSKSFLIDHPTKPGKKLQYGSLEGPEHGVYVRGRLTDNDTIELPDYWTALVDPDSITVNLTAMGSSQDLFVQSIADNKVIVGGGTRDIDCFYTVYAERVDVDKLEVEI